MSTDYLDPAELQEWQDALDSIVKHRGYQQAGDMLRSVSEHAEQTGIPLPQAITTPFKNTIAAENERTMPGDLFMERRIRSLIRWNAMAMVMRANDNEDRFRGSYFQLFLKRDAVRCGNESFFSRYG